MDGWPSLCPSTERAGAKLRVLYCVQKPVHKIKKAGVPTGFLVLTLRLQTISVRPHVLLGTF